MTSWNSATLMQKHLEKLQPLSIQSRTAMWFCTSVQVHAQNEIPLNIIENILKEIVHFHGEDDFFFFLIINGSIYGKQNFLFSFFWVLNRTGHNLGLCFANFVWDVSFDDYVRVKSRRPLAQRKKFCLAIFIYFHRQLVKDATIQVEKKKKNRKS